MGASDVVRRPMFTLGRRRALLRRRPQPVVPMELSDVGDQRGADPISRDRHVRWGRLGADLTVRRAIEIRDGVVQNPKILSFQSRSSTFPYPKQ